MVDAAVLIVAAGSGERAPGADNGVPKQYRHLAGRAVLRWAVDAFVRHAAISRVRVVIRPQDREHYEAAMTGLTLSAPVHGGKTRQESVRKGLESLAAAQPERVLIHDAARPFVSPAIIGNVVDALGGAEASAPLLPVADTLRRATATGYDLVSRTGLLRAQTPQGFHFGAILSAHRQFESIPMTDDIAVAERAGLSFQAVGGEEANLKLTTPEDFLLAERLARAPLSDVRTGTGFDVHRFSAGDRLWLCGVEIAHNKGLEGHSDADAGLHALTDAILGALGAGDIGMHFPPSDPQWRGASSHVFLAHAVSLLRARGGVLSHVDVTLICERPKIAPHREAMRHRIAEILALPVGRVSVKATTTEGLGFAGRGEGIAAQAVATIRLPE